MGTILSFSPRHDRSDRREEAESQPCRCEIVIFPGVRYERTVTCPDQERATGKAKRRDFLLIPD
ncbi:MAG TPA: hypothetical protein VF226_17520 [Hyphomicrobiaceae bacterium]|jgi:hypothetical protein